MGLFEEPSCMKNSQGQVQTYIFLLLALVSELNDMFPQSVVSRDQLCELLLLSGGAGSSDLT